MMMTTRNLKGEGHDIGVRYIFACVFMPNGHLVLACGTSGLFLFDKNFRLQVYLAQLTARNLCVASATEVLVTKGDVRQLQFVRVLPEMKPGAILRIDRNCYGIDVFGDVIYVTCHDTPGNGEVRVLDKNGGLLRSIRSQSGQPLFSQPDFVKVNTTGEKLFVTDSATNIVTCLDTRGHVIYRVQDETELKTPKGLLVDEDDSVYVCGHKSSTIHHVSPDGTVSNLLSTGNGVEYPLCLAVRSIDGCLAVGLMGKDKPLVTFRNAPFIRSRAHSSRL